MLKNNQLIVDLNLLKERKLSLEAWFILNCLFYDNSHALAGYSLYSRKIPAIIYQDLAERGFIEINPEAPLGALTFKDILLTKMSKEELFNFSTIEIGDLAGTDVKSFDVLFNEFKNVYPKKSGGRRLHQDLERAKKLYTKIISNKDKKPDLSIHESIISSTKKMIEEYTRTGRDQYYQLISTYLHQQNFKLYEEDDIDNNIGNDAFKTSL